VDQEKNGQQSRKDNKQPFPYQGLVSIVPAVFILFGVLYGLSRAFGITTERYTFFVLGGANILVFAAILFQALIYLRMAWQNERLISASEENANVARDAFHTGEAPYFGISKIAPEDFSGGGYSPHVKVTFMNGGKTPAWHFHSEAKFMVGKTIQEGESFDLKTNWHDLENTFSPSGESRTFEYVNSTLRHTAELQNDLESGRTYIFMLISIHYRDFRKVWHGRDFWLLWDETFKNFRDLDATRQNCKKCKKNGDHKNKFSISD
jgi:hypothetical protein